MTDFHTNLIGRIKLQHTGDVQIQNAKQKGTNGARSVVIYTRKKHCHSADEWQMYFSEGHFIGKYTDSIQACWLIKTITCD